MSIRKVMIVDDESLVRIGLQSMISWEENGYHIAGVFKNGEEALQAIQEQSFDIVLTDIKMPGMSGIELIRELKLIAPHIHVIILSSYSDFEYTRQAIQLGVNDYISKYELEQEELFRVLNNLPYNQENTIESNSNTNTFVEQWDQEIKLIFEQAVRQEKKKLDTPKWDQYCRQIDGKYIRWIQIIPCKRQHEYLPTEFTAMRLLVNEMFSRLKNPIFLGENDLAFHGISIESEHEFDGEAVEQHCERIANEWIAEFATHLNIAVKVYFGAPVVGINSWNNAYFEVKEAKMMSFYREERVLFLSKEIGKNIFSEKDWIEIHKKLRNKIQYLQFDVMTNECIQWLEESLETIHPKEWKKLFRLAVSQLADELIDRYYLDGDELEKNFIGLWPLPEYIDEAQSKYELISMIRIISEKAMSMVQKRQQHSWVDRIKEYIEQNYATAIRLEDAADYVNYGVNHFSVRFRQEVGEGFIDYVTKVRIREAAKLLRETDLSTETIAEKVGYPNANYFIKVFKKTTGQTISAFKKEGM